MLSALVSLWREHFRDRMQHRRRLQIALRRSSRNEVAFSFGGSLGFSFEKSVEMALAGDYQSNLTLVTPSRRGVYSLIKKTQAFFRPIHSAGSEVSWRVIRPVQRCPGVRTRGLLLGWGWGDTKTCIPLAINELQAAYRRVSQVGAASPGCDGIDLFQGRDTENPGP
jgi:hypothetical protein